MSLIVEDGTGMTTSESYTSVAFCDTYHANMGHTAWAAASTSNKEVALRQATQYLDAYYSGRFRGRKMLYNQALEWPRWGATTDDGYVLLTSPLPDQLQRACAELALKALTEDLMPDVAPEDSGSIAGSSIKVGPISESTVYGRGQGRRELKWYRLVGQILTQLTVPGGRVSRG